MGENDQQRHDPLGDVINLIAAPIAGGIRSVEQFRRGVDELFRTIDNLNNTLETINEAAARVNRFMADVEEPVRTILPQLTRTVQAADELMAAVGGPARRVAPNLVQIVDTLGSPAFTTLPTQLGRVHEGDGRRQPAPRSAGAVRRVGGRHVRVPDARIVGSQPAPAPEPTPLPPAAPQRRSSASTEEGDGQEGRGREEALSESDDV